MIPREFFVLETNAILPLNQYPTTQYQSRFTPQGLWETIVFPALTPHTRLQVIYLRQALEKMRADMSSGAAIKDQDHIKMVQYTKEEFRLYSLCFHELTRQIKFICKEQSELLVEIQSHYNAAVTRLINLIQSLQQQIDHHHNQFDELQAAYQKTIIENDRLMQQEQQTREVFENGSNNPRHSRVLLNYKQNRASRKDLVDSDLYDGLMAREDDDDEREAEWRRQRRACPQMGEVIRSSKRSSLAEENLAAAVLQTAYQKYNLRKEQHRLALRMGKNVAAIDIQRRYRGFRERQLVLHRRAVIQTILKRREQNAAIELLQANVRMFLANRRQTENKLALEDMLPVSTVSIPDTGTRSEPSSAVTVNHKFQGLTQGSNEAWNAEVISSKSPIDCLVTVLQQLIVVGATFTGDRVLGQSNVIPVEFASSKAEAENQSKETHEKAPTIYSNEQLMNVLAQAEQLVISFQSSTPAPENLQAIQTVKTLKEASGNQQETHHDKLISRSTSTSFLGIFEDNFPEFSSSKRINDVSPLDNQTDLNLATPTDERPPSDALNSPRKKVSVLIDIGQNASVVASPGPSNLDHIGDLHLDEALWETTVQSPMPAESFNLMQILSSRDQNKKLVWLKQFIADIYDTLAGKLRDQHPRWFSVNHHCALAMSCNEWQEHTRSTMHDQTLESFNIASMTRDHFHCQLGLRHLVDSAIANLKSCIDTFLEVDADVRRFNEFFNHDRSQDELRFFCVCRYLTSGANPLVPLEQPHSRQPVFHPVTMREIIDHTCALEMARKLFRVDEEEHILHEDQLLIEADNPVYARYLPSQGFHQFGSILSRYFSPVDIPANPTTSSNQSTLISPSSPLSPRYESGSLTRPSNLNQFHAKQYNVSAARSPLVRRLHQKSDHVLPMAPIQSNTSTWIHFDQLIDLLLKYRADMNHFHLFSKWARELFAQAAASLPVESPTEVDRRLLDETVFVDTLMPFSWGPTQRELQNIFHNALRQRGLQTLMPSRVFVSVVLLLLRNSMVSATSYRPLQKIARDSSLSPTSSTRREGHEQEWISLALKWRAYEREFEAIVERLYEEQPYASAERKAAASAHAVRLLQLRNELYELFIYRTGSTHLSRARDVFELLVLGLKQASGDSSDQDASSDGLFITPFDTERAEDDDDAQSRWETTELETATCL